MIPAVIVALIDVQYFLDSHTYDQWWDLFAISFVVAGLGIRVWTTGHTPRRTSGRNTKSQVADSLNTRGIYSIVRNPLYLGNFVGGLGVILLLHSLWLTLYYVLAFALYFERVILAEERFLLRKFGDSYRQ
jgi:protein-S-isoprenylcysteine O-methyltransferase Ste14